MLAGRGRIAARRWSKLAKEIMSKSSLADSVGSCYQVTGPGMFSISKCFHNSVKHYPELGARHLDRLTRWMSVIVQVEGKKKS